MPQSVADNEARLKSTMHARNLRGARAESTVVNSVSSPIARTPLKNQKETIMALDEMKTVCYVGNAIMAALSKR